MEQVSDWLGFTSEITFLLIHEMELGTLVLDVYTSSSRLQLAFALTPCPPPNRSPSPFSTWPWHPYQLNRITAAHPVHLWQMLAVISPDACTVTTSSASAAGLGVAS